MAIEDGDLHQKGKRRRTKGPETVAASVLVTDSKTKREKIHAALGYLSYHADADKNKKQTNLVESQKALQVETFNIF